MIIDISEYNNITNFNEVAKNVNGIIFRIGYRGWGKSGQIKLDKKFHFHLSKCHELGVPYGVYFVTQARTITEMLEECTFIQNYIEVEKILNPTLGVWLDSEYSTEPNKQGRADRLSKQDRTDLANCFFRFFEAIAVKNGLYCSDSWMDEKFIKEQLMSKHYWIARYGQNTGLALTMPNNECDLWQYTSVGKMVGINGHVDFNFIVDNRVKLPNLNGYKGESIVEGLKLNGYDSSFIFRKKIAEKLGINNYIGTAEQNLKLIELLR